MSSLAVKAWFDSEPELSAWFDPDLVGMVRTLSPSAIATAEAFGTQTVQSGTASIQPSGAATAEAFGTDKLNGQVRAAGIATAEAHGATKPVGIVRPQEPS